MNVERREQLYTVAKMLIIVACATLYAYGGMSHKFLRRFVAPAVCGFFCFGISRDWKTLLKMPLIGIASSLGYGADETWIKIAKRAYCGAAFGLGSQIDNLIKKKWLISVWSMVTIISSFIVLGVFNPLVARVEESFLGLIIYSMAIMPVKVKEG